MKGDTGVAVPILNVSSRRGWVVSVTPQLLCAWEKDPGPAVQKAGWILELVRMVQENLVPAMVRFRTLRPIVSCYTDSADPAAHLRVLEPKFKTPLCWAVVGT